jgi:tetratricopeptide (TPR) repeat protein
MKGLTVLLLITVLLTDPVKIGKINALKEEARKAYAAGDFKSAIDKYRFLVDSLHVTEDEVRLNLAHALFQAEDSVAATSTYQSVTGSAKADIRSKAHQQLGVLNNRQGKPEEALQHFKESIKANPANQEARYNYELLKKKLEEEKKKQQQQQQKDQNQQQDQQEKNREQQEKKDQQQKQHQPKEQQGEDQQQKEKPDDQQQKEQRQENNPEKKTEEQKPSPSTAEKLEQMNMSEEKAKMILEAMKNQEMQYLQQNKRKPTKPKDKGKPDW